MGVDSRCVQLILTGNTSYVSMINTLRSLSELVKHGENGLIFNDSRELAQQIFVKRSLNIDFIV